MVVVYYSTSVCCFISSVPDCASICALDTWPLNCTFNVITVIMADRQNKSFLWPPFHSDPFLTPHRLNLEVEQLSFGCSIHFHSPSFHFIAYMCNRNLLWPPFKEPFTMAEFPNTSTIMMLLLATHW